MNATLLAVLAFASYRLTRLAIYDTIFETPRNAFYGWLNEPVTVDHRTWGTALLIAAQPFWLIGAASVAWGPPRAAWALIPIAAALISAGVLIGFRFWLFTLITCQWCLGVWISAAVTATTALVVDGVHAYLWCLTGLAVAAAQSMLHLVEDALSEYITVMSQRRERGDG